MKVDVNDWESYEDMDDMYDEMKGTEYSRNKKQKREKQKKNNYEENLQQSQGMPAGWREGDSHIGKSKKARNYGS